MEACDDGPRAPPGSALNTRKRSSRPFRETLAFRGFRARCRLAERGPRRGTSISLVLGAGSSPGSGIGAPNADGNQVASADSSPAAQDLRRAGVPNSTRFG